MMLQAAHRKLSQHSNHESETSFALHSLCATGRAPTTRTSTSRPVQQSGAAKAYLHSDPKLPQVSPLPCGCAQARSSRSRGCFVRHAGKHVKTFGAGSLQENHLALADDTSFAPRTPLQRDANGPVPNICAQRTSRSLGDRILGQAAISGLPRWNGH